jgi:hypothetical protein
VFSLVAQQRVEPPKRSSKLLFTEVAEQVGLRFEHYNGMTGKFHLPEITGSGAALTRHVAGSFETISPLRKTVVPRFPSRM